MANLINSNCVTLKSEDFKAETKSLSTNIELEVLDAEGFQSLIMDAAPLIKQYIKGEKLDRTKAYKHNINQGFEDG